VASGNTFPDALTVGAAAASARAPMVLVGSAPSPVDKTTADLLMGMGTTSVRVAGGTAVVADASVATITASIADTRRMSGADRFLTAAEISKSEFSPTTSHAYIVNGMNFPDGLVTAPLAATTKAPIYLAMGDCVPQQVFAELARLGVTNLTLVGGPTVLTAAVEGLRRCA
jgi:putative cell wall-binding protein